MHVHMAAEAAALMPHLVHTAAQLKAVTPTDKRVCALLLLKRNSSAACAAATANHFERDLKLCPDLARADSKKGHIYCSMQHPETSTRPLSGA